jgi:hypothetical protein
MRTWGLIMTTPDINKSRSGRGAKGVTCPLEEAKFFSNIELMAAYLFELERDIEAEERRGAFPLLPST